MSAWLPRPTLEWFGVAGWARDYPVQVEFSRTVLTPITLGIAPVHSMTAVQVTHRHYHQDYVTYIHCLPAIVWD